MDIDRIMSILQKAIVECSTQDGRASVAIVDAGGNLVAFQRMPGANLVTIDTAIGKAYTAVAIGADSGVLHQAMQPGAPLFGMQAMTMQPHPLVPFAGGVPIVNADQEIIGAIGVSGMPDSSSDEVIARQALV